MKRVDLKKILYMDFLIRHKCTGTSKEFAAKMDMSRSTLFEYIAYMRDELEVCILFDKFLGTYYYDGKNLYTSLGFKVVEKRGMFEFLFDIKPDAGNVCPTTRLAYLISERGNKVYYTDTSDSVFTTGLLRKGIGRIIYPHDFRWFTPHLALLDYQLQDKQQVYNEYDINYLFIAINKTDRKIDLMPEMPVVTLPPIPYKLLPQGAKDDDFIDKLTEIKEDRSRTVIIGLLEDEEEERKVNTPSHTESFYKAIKQSASIHPQYQFILLTNHGEVETRLFSLPPNIAIYRLPRLQALLPLCDMALITGGITHWTECTFAHVPMAEFTPQEIKKITPVKLDRQIIDLLANREYIIERQKHLCAFFESESERMNEIADWLINRVKQKRQL